MPILTLFLSLAIERWKAGENSLGCHLGLMADVGLSSPLSLRLDRKRSSAVGSPRSPHREWHMPHWEQHRLAGRPLWVRSWGINGGRVFLFWWEKCWFSIFFISPFWSHTHLCLGHQWLGEGCWSFGLAGDTLAREMPSLGALVLFLGGRRWVQVWVSIPLYQLAP